MEKEKEKKEEISRGITLIALVITIIVLLILAGITIATLIGDNGILKRATEAVEETEKKTAEEKVAVEVLGSYGKNGQLDYGLLEENLNNIEGIKGVPSPISQDDFPLVVNVDGYDVTINADGSVSVDNNGQSGVKTVENLKAGEKVYYNTGNVNIGEKGIIECIVLYDEEYNKEKGTNYGIQIISSDVVENEVILGDNNNFNVSMNSYNDALETLYEKAQDYLNPIYVSSARCVGSNPDNPKWDTDEKFIADSSYTYMNEYNNMFDIGDQNYITDYTQMNSEKLKITNIGKNYWLASRYINSSSEASFFAVYNINDKGELYGRSLCNISPNGSIYMSGYPYGLRPVFTLKSGIKVTGGDGINTPYTLSP